MRKPIFFRTVLAILLIVFVGIGVAQAREHTQLQLNHSIELKSREAKLIELDNKYNELLQDKSQTVEEKTKRIKELEKEKERLENELQAKRNTPSKLQRTATNTLNSLGGSRTAYAQRNASCADWIAQANINDIGSARELINRESGCNPHAVNSSSGACGVAQELPCGKSGCSLGDGACQVRWMNSYVLGRYGSWASAVNFHNSNNWY